MIVGESEHRPVAPGEAKGLSPDDTSTRLAGQLEQLYEALAAARDPSEFLRALINHLEFLAPHPPRAASLHYVPTPEEERGSELYLAGEWHHPAHPPLRKPGATRSFLAELLGDAQSLPASVQLIDEVAREASLPASLRERLRTDGVSSLAILPIYLRGHDEGRAIIAIEWSDPHAFNVVEHRAYRLLRHSLTAFVSGLRSRQGQAEALAEMRTLYEIGTQLNSASNMQEILNILASPVAGTAADHARLCSVVRDADGAPVAIQVEAEWGIPLNPRPIGDRRPLSMADQLVRESPGTPIIIEDADIADSRRNELALRMRKNGIDALVLLPLYIQNRWLGHASLMWRSPQRFGPRERRLFASVIKQAAVALDNRWHIEQAERALRENQEGRQLLSSILDSLPLGVWVLDAQTLERQLVNRAGSALAAQIPAVRDGAAIPELCYPDTDTPIPIAELPFQRRLQPDKTERMEIDIVAPGGGRRSLECIAAPLARTSGTLSSVIAVFSDITDQRQAAQERLRIQGELINVQAAALAERSTPVIPLSEKTLVMPIIGSIDQTRSGQIMDSLLTAITRTGARVALIDITGVPMVDSMAAAGLLNAARAVRLLGAEVVLTGIRAEVAQTLVRLGMDLNAIVTHGTLQAGIAYTRKRWEKNS